MPDEEEWLSELVCVNAVEVPSQAFMFFKCKHFQRNYIEMCEAGAGCLDDCIFIHKVVVTLYQISGAVVVMWAD